MFDLIDDNVDNKEEIIRIHSVKPKYDYDDENVMKIHTKGFFELARTINEEFGDDDDEDLDKMKKSIIVMHTLLGNINGTANTLDDVYKEMIDELNFTEDICNFAYDKLVEYGCIVEIDEENIKFNYIPNEE